MAFPWHSSHGTELDGNHILGCSLAKAGLPGEEGQTSWMDTRRLSPGEEGRVGAVVLLGQWDPSRPSARTLDKGACPWGSKLGAGPAEATVA